ncbi:MAG TPA: anthranilate phosphoribosyltransferase, partial [Rhizobiaceae bacterium]|nr:anthranilate phosphoribosyltransferase [Rhizobiaceae bacterium]
MADFKTFVARAASGEPLSRGEAEQAFDLMMSGEATPTQIGGFLMALRVRGETVDEIAGAVSTMRAKMMRVNAPQDAIDIVGTGGDASGSYNVSTCAAFIAAGAGLRIAKHGNRSLSSKSGAADALKALGVNIDITPDRISRCIAEAGVGFMFAPAHHAAMRHVGPSRVELGTRTIFNLLGPLSNPAGVTRQLVGVFSPDWVEPIAQVLLSLGSQSAWVVHGDGLDEMTTTGETRVAEVRDGAVRSFTIRPQDAGLKQASMSDLLGRAPEHNAA